MLPHPDSPEYAAALEHRATQIRIERHGEHTLHQLGVRTTLIERMDILQQSIDRLQVSLDMLTAPGWWARQWRTLKTWFGFA